MQKPTAFLVLLFSTINIAQAGLKAAIGTDERQASNEPRVGRLSAGSFGGKGCSGALIGKSCMVSAGHCLGVLGTVEFNTGGGSKWTGMKTADKQDMYDVDKKTIVKEFKGAGEEDWAVFRIKKHDDLGGLRLKRIAKKQGEAVAAKYAKFTEGYYPGDIQGFYGVTYEAMQVGDYLRITGYGNTNDYVTSNTQQTAVGFVTKVGTMWGDATVFFHDVDSTKGNSGSGVINEDSGKVVGVHTFQECTTPRDVRYPTTCRNGGTVLSNTPKFQAAIRACLQFEEDNLK